MEKTLTALSITCLYLAVRTCYIIKIFNFLAKKCDMPCHAVCMFVCQREKHLDKEVSLTKTAVNICRMKKTEIELEYLRQHQQLVFLR